MGNLQFTQDAAIIPGLSPVAPLVIYQSGAQYTEGDAATENVAAIDIPQNFLAPGTTFRVTMSGTKTGNTGSMGVQVSFGSTAVLTITADDTTAVDWVAILYVHVSALAVQKSFGQLLTDTADPATDYNGATVDVSKGAKMYVQMVNGHGDDEITCEYCLVEMWKK